MKHAFVPAVAAVAFFEPLLAFSLASCSPSHNSAAPADAGHDVTAPPRDASPPPVGAFCSLPGSVVWSGQGPSVVGGVPPSSPDLTWLSLPPGFCAHYFGVVPDVRQIRFAPGGELFATSPRTATTGGNYTEGLSAILVLPDDDRNGVADTNITFLDGLPSTQGILFANDSFYYQDGFTIRSVAYRNGDRTPSASPKVVTDISKAAPQDGLHWPKVMDVSADGTLYVSNGGSQGDQCIQGNPTRGAIFALKPDGTTSLVSKGFRNPIAMRCEPNHNVCLAAELALDYSADHGGREKVVPVRLGDDWGYPCCATRNLPYGGTTYTGGGTPDCSGVPEEGDSFIIGHTPFGLDFERGKWPAPYGGRVYVTLHGVAGSWEGARVVAIGLDPTTGLPVPATEFEGGAPDPDAMLEFASGWDDNMHDHGRPAPVAFAADGRLFLGNDRDGTIVWIAPAGLMPQ